MIARATRFKTSFAPLASICALAILAIPGAAAGAVSSPELSLTFPSDEAHVSGSRASFWVECSGSDTSTCNGTVTLTTNGNKHKVPFSVVAGTRQNLTVRLGAHSTAKRVVAVAKTAQEDGRYVRSWGLLELR